MIDDYIKKKNVTQTKKNIMKIEWMKKYNNYYVLQ